VLCGLRRRTRTPILLEHGSHVGGSPTSGDSPPDHSIDRDPRHADRTSGRLQSRKRSGSTADRSDNHLVALNNHLFDLDVPKRLASLPRCTRPNSFAALLVVADPVADEVLGNQSVCDFGPALIEDLFNKADNDLLLIASSDPLAMVGGFTRSGTAGVRLHSRTRVSVHSWVVHPALQNANTMPELPGPRIELETSPFDGYRNHGRRS